MSGSATAPQTALAFSLFIIMPLGVVGGIFVYLLHGYGVI